MVDTKSFDLPVQWIYYGCNQEDEARIAGYWRTHGQRLIAKASELQDAVGQLNVVIEHDTDNECWRSQATLYVPGSAVVAEVEMGTAEEVVEATITSLSGEINRYLEAPEKGSGNRNLQGLVSVLASLHRQERSEAFMRLLFPLIASVGPYIRRELQVREITGEFAPSNVTPTDVMDDVLLEAWTRFPHRNTKRDLDLWLVELADDILKRLEDPVGTVSLNDRIPVPSPNERNSRMDEWVEQVSYFDRIELARMLEAERSIDAWDEDVLERTQRQLAELLGEMPRDERQALVLSAALGFSASEIADFLNRQLSDVEALIDAASRRLRNDRRFEDLREIEETMARKDIRDERKRHSAQR